MTPLHRQRYAEKEAAGLRPEAENAAEKRTGESTNGGKRMLYTKLTKKALRICFDAHRDQVDKSGLPYVFHPFHVAEQMETEEEICTALLHDVLEDTPMTREELGREGFPQSVLDALTLLTRDPAVPYMEYIAAVKENALARRVKLADLAHNSDSGRLDRLTEKDLKRLKKYSAARAVLEAEQDC